MNFYAPKKVEFWFFQKRFVWLIADDDLAVGNLVKFYCCINVLCEKMTQGTPDYMSHVTRDWPSFIHSFRQQAINIIPLREISKERICCLFHVNISFYAFIHRYFNFKVVVVAVVVNVVVPLRLYAMLWVIPQKQNKTKIKIYTKFFR